MLDRTILDASVVINVLGCGKARAVLRAFPGRIIVPDVTSREILRDPVDPRVVRTCLSNWSTLA
jgi:hypothetical protein